MEPWSPRQVMNVSDRFLLGGSKLIKTTRMVTTLKEELGVGTIFIWSPFFYVDTRVGIKTFRQKLKDEIETYLQSLG